MMRKILFCFLFGLTGMCSNGYAIQFDYCPAQVFSKERVLAVATDRYAVGYFAFRTTESKETWRFLDAKYGDYKENYEVAMLYTALNAGLKLTYVCDGKYVISMELTVED